MHGGVSNGHGKRWNWQDALNLCKGTKNAIATIGCFERKIKRKGSMQAAIKDCNQVNTRRVVRDHRWPAPPVVRDHRWPAPPVVRDHRRPAPPVVRDHRRPAPPVVRDHRRPAPPVVRDHRRPPPPVASRSEHRPSASASDHRRSRVDLSKPSQERQWMIGVGTKGYIYPHPFRKGTYKGAGYYNIKGSVNRRFLYNKHTGTGRGINLGWTDNATANTAVKRAQWFFARKSKGNIPLRYGERVAIGIGKGRPYIRYAHRYNGINLDWSKAPIYEWQILGGKSGEYVKKGKDWVILYNLKHRQPLIYFHRNKFGGGDIGWSDSRGWRNPLTPRPESPQSTWHAKKIYTFIRNSANNDDHYGLFDETQGLANGDPRVGDSFWYFSKNIDSNSNTYIYRVSYTKHLAHNFPYRVRKIQLRGGRGVCGHVGDIDYHVYRGRGYIVAGYDECPDKKARIAFFRAEDINGARNILAPRAVMVVRRVQGKGAPWVAVHPDGRIFSSMGGHDQPNKVFEYTINWDQIRVGRNPSYQSRSLNMVDRRGRRIDMPYKQGGAISTDGHRFFISMGLQGFHNPKTIRGLWVFNLESNRLVLAQRSSNSRKPFKFQTNNRDQEPEGISYFDTARIKGYNHDMPRGSLHAILLNNNIIKSDQVWIKHYAEMTLHTSK